MKNLSNTVLTYPNIVVTFRLLIKCHNCGKLQWREWPENGILAFCEFCPKVKATPINNKESLN